MKNDFCLIFDMDGTLWDATGSILNSANEVLEKEKGWKDYLDLDTLSRVMGLEIEEIANIYFPELEQEEKMDLIYKSTRNNQETATASEAILKGLAGEGGLFVPSYIPKLISTSLSSVIIGILRFFKNISAVCLALANGEQ